MGLLDEAIRDHLDLKRRRGADPTEIERAEREALGPVRRDPFEQGPDDFESGALPDDRPGAYDHEEELYDDERYEDHGVETEWDEEFEDRPHDPRAVPEGFSEEEPGELGDSTTVMDHESLGESQAPASREYLEEPQAPTDHEYLEEPQAPASHESSAPPPYPTEAGAGDETMQYDVEEALAAEQPQTGAEPSSEWVEQSDEWVEQSEEWIEPPHRSPQQAGEPPYEPMERPHEPPESREPLESTREPAEHGAPPAEPGPAHLNPAEHDVSPEESQPHREPPPSHDPEAEGRGEPEQDVLDETPGFLQDEPDQDRLWFEQRPPRDFDFDG